MIVPMSAPRLLVIEGNTAEGRDLQLAAGGAIASVIPPSILMIIYGAAAEQSVAKLFIGGFLPGLLIGLLLASIKGSSEG